MERGRIYEALQPLNPFKVVFAAREAIVRRREANLGTLAERDAAYKRLVDQCDLLFLKHKEHVRGMLTSAGDVICERLMLSCPTGGPDEILIDKRNAGKYKIVGIYSDIEAGGSRVIQDRQRIIVGGVFGTYQTAHNVILHPTFWTFYR